MVNTTNTTLERLAPQLRAEVLAKAFWALGNPVRTRILEILLDEDELTVGNLVSQLSISQPQVSFHLRCLTDCGFTSVRREGRHAFYRISSRWVVGVMSLMRSHAGENCEGLLLCAGCLPKEAD